MFPIGFAVEVDPEFPADGGEPPQRIPEGLLRIGAVLRITPPGSPAWDIAVGAPNWWRSPSRAAIAVLSDGAGYVLDVVERRVLLEIDDVTRVREDQLHDVLLFATGTGLVAAGADGIVWRDDGFWPDLKVKRIERDVIICTIYAADGRAEVRFDPRDGARL